MENPSPIRYESSYRQLDNAARMMVDDLISRIEATSDRTGAPLFEVLGRYVPDAREQEMLSRPIVKAAVFDRIRDLTEAQDISPRRIMKEIAALAFSSIDHFRKPGGLLSDGLELDPNAMFSDGGGLFELEYATPEQRAAVKEVEIEEQVRTGKIKTKIKLHDKLGALRMLGQIRGLFDDDGNAINKEAWVAGGVGIAATASVQEASDAYARLIGDE